MMKQIHMTESMHIAMDRFEEEAARDQAFQNRFIAAAARELGLDPQDPRVKFDRVNRTYLFDEPNGNGASAADKGMAGTSSESA